MSPKMDMGPKVVYVIVVCFAFSRWLLIVVALASWVVFWFCQSFLIFSAFALYV